MLIPHGLRLCFALLSTTRHSPDHRFHTAGWMLPAIDPNK
jgi:hypothetical protein